MKFTSTVQVTNCDHIGFLTLVNTFKNESFSFRDIMKSQQQKLGQQMCLMYDSVYACVGIRRNKSPNSSRQQDSI